ncbi:hypothetical protein FACS1894152_8030 [Bacilli bacterium]|nr:hypothetical protein FACS1894152_8030 [Bacilli bacterium]
MFKLFFYSSLDYRTSDVFYNFCVKYNCNIKNYPIINVTGQILYGKYINHGIYIEKLENNDNYILTLWDKDDNTNQSKEKIRDFFVENDTIVKWEKEEKDYL